MKKILTILCLLPLALGAEPKLINKNRPEKIKGAEFLITYPRSGTNWTMAIIQVLTKRPIRVLGDLNNLNDDWINILRLELDDTKPVLYRRHVLHPVLRQIDHSQNKLIATLRNYKECIVRRRGLSAEEFRDVVVQNQPLFKQYIENLRFFDKGWKDENTKHLIYYEELISQPRETIEELMAFLGEEPEGLEDFFENYDYWRERSLSRYPSKSQGDKEIYHSKDFPIEILREVDAHIKKKYPYLWNKYLCRYETK